MIVRESFSSVQKLSESTIRVDGHQIQCELIRLTWYQNCPSPGGWGRGVGEEHKPSVQRYVGTVCASCGLPSGIRSTCFCSTFAALKEHQIRGWKLEMHKPRNTKIVCRYFQNFSGPNGSSIMCPSIDQLWRMKCSWLLSFRRLKFSLSVWAIVVLSVKADLWAECSIDLRHHP